MCLTPFCSLVSPVNVYIAWKKRYNRNQYRTLFKQTKPGIITVTEHKGKQKNGLQPFAVANSLANYSNFGFS